MSLPRPEEREHVGPYRVVKAIGAGGSARVDLASLKRAYGFERHVVLKRPLEHLRGDRSVARTLQREAALGGRLVHPNLVAVLDAGTHDGYDYLALEYVDGLSLRELMRESRGEVQALPLAAALSIVVGVARGLHEAHELADDDGSPLGLVHRDVSPSNVLLGRDGSIKLSDFGIAKDTRVSTLSGSMRGTVTYMAPEQCRGHAFDRRADIFSLGVILHELLTRRRLFWADNDVASLHRVLSGDVPDPRSVDPAVAPELAALAMEALAYDALARIPTAAELADRLEAFALSTGLILGGRAVARVVEATVEAPPRTRPATWSSEPDEPSLIAAIEGANAPIVPPLASSAHSASAHSASAPPAPMLLMPTSPFEANTSRHRSRRWVALPIALALASGGVIAWRVTRSAETSTSSAPTSATGAPTSATAAPVADPLAVPATDTAAAAKPTTDAAVVAEPNTDTERATGAAKPSDDVATPAKPAVTKRATPSRRPSAKPSAKSKRRPPATTSTKTTTTTTKPTPKVEWNQNMLLPTDQAEKRK